MIKKHMSRKNNLIEINFKNILYMLISFKFNYISYKIEENIVWINKIYLYLRTNLIIYVIVLDFLIHLKTKKVCNKS